MNNLLLTPFMTTLDSRYGLLFWLTLLLGLGFVGGSGVNYMITKASVHREIVQNDLPLTMNNIYSDISSELTRPILVASSMAADTFLQDWVLNGEQDEEKVRKYLLEIKEKYDFFSTFFISSYTQRYYHYTGVHKVISPGDSHDVWYYRFIGSEKEYDLDVDTDEASTNVLTVFINFRLEDDDGNLLGVTGVGLKMDNLAAIVGQYRERFGRNVFLTDSEGLVQIHPDMSLIEQATIADITRMPDVSKQLAAITQKPVHFAYERDGDTIIINGRYIENMRWLLFVEQNETETLRDARANFLRAVAIGLITSGIVVLLTLLTINRYQRLLEKLAVSDELTGCSNRRKLEEEYSRFVARSSRSGKPFTLILMDLDGFKEVNDTMGHLAGDKVLQTIGTLLTGITRPTDELARWGGDEFALLTESTGEDARIMAERIRQAVETIAWDTTREHDPRKKLSISLGIATFQDKETFAAMLNRADKALYHCKELGGNRISPAQ